MPPWAADTEMVDGEKIDPAAAEVEKGETAHAGSDDDDTVEMPPVAAVVPLSALLVSGPSHGSLTLNADGSLTYSPDDNFNGSDSFTYRASDGSLAPDSATVNLTVTARHHPPTVTVAVGGRCGRDHNSGRVNLTVPDVESPAADLTLSAASSNPALASTSNVNFAGSGAAQTMTVSALPGRSGTAILTVTVTDGLACDSVQVTVKVGGSGKDTLTGGSCADQFLAQSNNDAQSGADGKDLLRGNSGSDTLSGGTADDSLGDGSGNDQLTGGSGADRFSGGSVTEAATDFTAGSAEPA
jgi:Ca2+-binding RTX toxin-like protein